VSPLGMGTEATWKALLAGQPGAGPITLFDASRHSVRFAAEVKGFDPLDWVPRKDVKKMDRFIQLGIAAADMALSDAGLRIDSANAERVGVFIGSGIGGFGSIEREHEVLLEQGPRRISPFFIPSAIANLASGWVSIRTGAKGPSSATCTACTSSAHAIGDSFRLIQRGDADVMIAGGSEAAITPLGVGGFAAMRALSTRILVLEELGAAEQRGAHSYCELVGYGMSSDAHHITAPCEDGDGGVRVMRLTLADAGVSPSEVDYVNVHGTSTAQGDKVEVGALKAVFGDHFKGLAVSSTKSMTGHLLGASGGLEAGIVALSLRDGMIAPTINHDNPDPECDVDCVANVGRKAELSIALSNSFGFGGTNGSLLFRKLG